jgi:hypothetical protein
MVEYAFTNFFTFSCMYGSYSIRILILIPSLFAFLVSSSMTDSLSYLLNVFGVENMTHISSVAELITLEVSV